MQLQLPFEGSVILVLAVVIASLAFVTVVWIMLYVLFRHWQLTRVFPGEVPILSTSLPYLGHALDLGKQPVEFLMTCAAATTEVFGMLAGGQRIFIIHDPLSAHVMLKTNKSLSIAEFQDIVLRDMFNTPEQIVHSPYVDWDMTRKGYGHYLLSERSLDVLCRRMMKKFPEMYRLQLSGSSLSSDEKKVEVKLYDFVARFIFHVAVGTLFNGSINDNLEKCDALFDAFHVFDHSVPYCLAGIPISFQRKAFAAFNHFVKAIDPLKEDLSEFVQQRSHYFEGVAEKDPIFLGKNGILNSPIFWASSSNSMPALFWLMYFLMKSSSSMPSLKKNEKNYFEVIREEIREKIPNWERFLAKNFTPRSPIDVADSSFLTNEQLNDLYFIDACFTETLRLVSGSFILRIVMEEQFQLTLNSGNSYRFRKGDRVGVYPGLFHKNPRIFPDPEEFNPYRWIQGDTHEDKILAAQGRIPLFYEGKELNPANVFIPFGAGLGHCPGRKFIRAEVKFFAIFLILNLDFEFKHPPANTDSIVDIPFDGSRAGVGVFPPARDVEIFISPRK